MPNYNPPKWLENLDVEPMMRPHTLADVESLRAEFTDFVFDGDLPTDIPCVSEDISDRYFSNLPYLKQIDRLTYRTAVEGIGGGVPSVGYLFHTSNPGPQNRVVIYHEGHWDEGFRAGRDNISYFLQRGYHVLAYSMPLMGYNYKVWANLGPRLGLLQMTTHQHLCFLEDRIPVLSLFAGPVVAGLNYLDTQGFGDYQMLGYSGGGWTTLLVSALDTRIKRSCPTATALPTHLTSIPPNDPQDIGHYEQRLLVLPPSPVTYMDLYILSATGTVESPRRMLHCLTKNDPCCYAGEHFRTYVWAVKDRVNKIGGGLYGVSLDSEATIHALTPKHRLTIANDLVRNQ